MTERRRFFPAKRVQTVPGKTVELAANLQPLAPPVAATVGCACDVAGVAWFPDWQVWCNYDQYGHAPIVQSAVDGQQLWPILAPASVEGRLTGMYQYIPGGTADWVARLRGVVLGKTLCDVAWTWTLDVPDMPVEGSYTSWWDGVEVKEEDGTLMVRVLRGEDVYSVSFDWFAELKATATCAGEVVGTLRVRFVFPSFTLELVPDWNKWPGTPPVPCPP